MKNSIILNVLLLFQAPMAAVICLPEGLTLEKAQDLLYIKRIQGNIECAFDIHETLLEKNPKKIKKEIITYPYKWAVIANIFNLPVMAQAGFYVWNQGARLACNALSHCNVKAFYGEMLLELFIRTNAKDLAALIANITNAQEIKLGIIYILNRLHTNGITLRVASNIRLEIFQKLKNDFSKEGKNIFNLFAKDERGLEGKLIEQRGIASSPIKPTAAYFKEYTQLYNPGHRKIIIFIDDIGENVGTAVSQGMIGIHFKSVKRLYRDLQVLGLLP